jgi:ketosteroid isomerase-like protein
MTASASQDQALLKAFGEAFNAHDATALVSMMTDDCVFRTAMGPEAHGNAIVGQAAVKAAFEATFAAFPDAQWVPRSLDQVIGNRGFSEWTFIATRAADGAKFHMDGVDLFILRDGKIAVKDAYRKDRPPITA